MANWHEDVLQFWFAGSSEASLSVSRPEWFRKDAAFDASIRSQFSTVLASLAAGELKPDPAEARQILAWLIVADQFPRNLYRGAAQAFATDAAALAVSKAALAAGRDQQLPPVARWFVYLPLEHSENLADQHEAVRRFESLPPDSAGRDSVVDYAHLHRAVIEQFGRFPHRNAALRRPSTPAELLYLAQPGNGF